MTRLISRRTVLQGLGASIALPWLEAMGPLSAWASQAPAANRTPMRMAFLYVPNGKNMVEWTPTATGADFTLPRILQPLAEVREYVSVLTGLTADKARPNGDGPGDHARAMAAFLTGAQPRKTAGSDIRVGLSVDQAAAARIGSQTRLPSLEIGADPSALAGNCDSGYSCAYSSTISWRSATQPMPKLNNPRQIFDRLFTSGPDANRVRADRNRRSILDFVREDAAGLQNRLGINDRRKLEEYLGAIRDIEQRIERAARLPEPRRPNLTLPTGIPRDYQEHLRLLADLLVLAFQADITRVSTFVFANEGSNKPYPFIEVREGHHDLSHHGNDRTKLQKIGTINRFHVTQLAYLLNRLKNIREGDRTLLDNCMIAYGSGNSDGNRHNHDDLPILLCGRGSGTIRSGRHVRYARNTPLNNLWLSMLDRMGTRVDRLGDSTGRLGELT
ncbi:MAG: DUF1552 domain-containing protein [Planctomycetes bacterium]|nr:DUF1552 domain-containing protein [Planctomycetota bacterium]